METISILLGIVFWPAAIIVWFLFIRVWKPPKWIRIVGTLLIVGMPVLAAYSLGQFMFLDEPLVGAVMSGDVGKAKSLLTWGASPDAAIDGRHALVWAASGGEKEM